MGRRVCWLLATAAAFYMAVIYRSKAFLMLGMTGVLFLPFLTGVLFYYGRKLQVHLELPQSAQEQKKEYPIGVWMGNIPTAYLSRVRVKLVLKNQASLKRHTFWLKKAGNSGENSLYLECRVRHLEFGMWKVSCPKIYLYDFLGFGRMCRSCREARYFMILPACHRISIRTGIRVKWFMSDGEQYDPNTGGDDPAEIFRLREYRDGDRQNHIHWKLSARNDTLIVKERSMPVGCNVVFFLDLETSKERHRQNSSFWETVYTIAGELLTQECFYYLVWFDQEHLELVRRRVMSKEDLYAFWGEILAYQLGSCQFPKEYQRAFGGDLYAADIRLTASLELYCNGMLLEQLKGKELAERLSELEIVL